MYKKLVEIRAKSVRNIDNFQCTDLKLKCMDLFEDILDKINYEDECDIESMLYDLMTTYGYLSFKQGVLTCEENYKSKA